MITTATDPFHPPAADLRQIGRSATAGTDNSRLATQWSEERLRSINRVAAVTAMLIAAIALAGWIFDIPALTAGSAQWVAMNPLVTIAVLLRGTAQLLPAAAMSDQRVRIAAAAIALALAATGSLVLLRDVPGLDFPIDHLLFGAQVALAHRGGMASVEALALLLLGAALANRVFPYRHANSIAQGLALGVLAACILAALGYLYGAQQLQEFTPYNGFALLSALALGALSISLLAAHGPSGWLAHVVSKRMEGTTLRRLWLPACLMIVVLGWLRLQGENAGYYQTEFGLALMIFLALAVLTGLAWHTARRLDDVDRRRSIAEMEKARLYAELEQRIEARTAELSAANRELESFTYSVSHDLRAPLRAIDGFSRLLVEKHAAALNAEAQRYLGRVRDNAQQMGALIDDLLAFSRTGRKPMARQPIDTRDLVRQCLDVLCPDYDGNPAGIAIGDLPDCNGDPGLIRQVWMNLLENALKFSSKRATPRIEIGSRQAGNERAYYVRDNGTGFDMRYADKLFGVFQRLHTTAEFPGTGVGLALAQRIVHRHGGRIWAEARPGHGATFYFTMGETHVQG